MIQTEGGGGEKYKRKLIGESPKIKDAYQSRPTDIQIIIYKQSTGHKFHCLAAKTKNYCVFLSSHILILE